MTEFLIMYLIVVGISFISSSIVLFILLTMSYKDYSTYLRIYLTLIDIASEIFLVMAYFYSNSTYECYYNWLYYFIIIFRSFWICFMAFSLYMIICKSKSNINKKEYLFFLIFLIISLLLSLPTLTPSWCFVPKSLATPKILPIQQFIQHFSNDLTNIVGYLKNEGKSMPAIYFIKKIKIH